MKVRAVKRYNDLVLKKVVDKGTEFDVSEDRAKYLKGQGMVELLEESEKSEQKEKKEPVK